MQLFSLLSALVMAQTSAVKPATNGLGYNIKKCLPAAKLIFDPPALAIDDFNLKTPFGVRLSQKPTGKVNYIFSASGISFSKCTLEFDENNWDQYQNISVSSRPFQVIPVKMEFDIAVMTPSGSIKDAYPVTRMARLAAVGGSSGDPHLVTFQGRKIESQIHAVEYLFKSNLVDVQVVQGQCGTSQKVFCNRAIAVRYGSSTIIYDPRSGKPVVSKLGQDEPGFSFENLSFKMPDGSQVSITNPVGAKFGSYVNVNVLLTPAIAITGGGLLNKAGENDTLIMPNGMIAPSNALFVESWRVPQSENAFLGKAVVVPSDNTVMNFCNGKPLVAAAPRLTLPLYNGTWDPIQKVKRHEEPIHIDEVIMEQISNTCSTAFTNLDSCTIGKEPYIEACIFDAQVSGGYEMLHGQVESYRNQCNQVAKGALETGKGIAFIEAVAADIITETGYGIMNPCPNNCSANGVCGASGCSCNKGFSKADCSLELPL